MRAFVGKNEHEMSIDLNTKGLCQRNRYNVITFVSGYQYTGLIICPRISNFIYFTDREQIYLT